MQLILVRFRELELVQVDEIDPDLVQGLEQSPELGLLFGEDGDLHPTSDAPVRCRLEHRAIGAAGGRERSPEVVRDVETELVETRVGQAAQLLRVRFVGIEVDVVLVPELALEESNVMFDAVDNAKRVAPGDPRPGRPDRPRLVEHIRVGRDPSLVRVDPVELVAGGRHRAVETAKAAQSRHKEHHLASLLALRARRGELAPIAGGHRKQVEAVRFHGRRGTSPSR